MKVFVLAVFFIVFVVGAIFFSQRAYSPEPTGPVLKNFSLIDLNGRVMELFRLRGSAAVVFFSYGIGCPIVRKSIPLLNELYKKYSPLGVQFFLLDSNVQDGRRALVEEARDFDIHVPILVDDAQLVAKELQIDRTGEAIIVDPKTWKTVYRGPIDDRLGYGVEKLEAGENYLENALNAFLGNKPIQKKEIASLGCSISFDKYENVSYRRDIAPILIEKCSTCHFEQGSPPTNLWTYSDLKGWSSMLKEVIRTEQMPPWEADGYYGEVRGDLRLTRQEKQKIFSWIDNGFPEGDGPSVQPKRRKLKSFSSDLRFGMKSEIEIPPATKTPWHYEEVLHTTGQDVLFSKLKIDVTNPKIIQHSALIVTSQPLDLSKNTFQPQFTQRDKIYSIIRLPRSSVWSIPKNLAFRIPKNSYVYLELHVGLTGKSEKLKVGFDLQRANKSRSTKEIIYRPISVFPPGSKIAPQAARHVEKQTVEVDRDTYLWSLAPHMHWRGQYARLTEVQKNGDRRVLFSSRYLYKVRRAFTFEHPVLVRAGSKVEVEFEYDNSLSNSAKIDPDREVFWGVDDLKDEMGILFLYVFYKDAN